MAEISQEELDNARRNRTVINKHDVLEVIENHFLDAINSLKIRSSYDQTIMGNYTTTLEIELKKKIKQLEEKQL